MQLTHEMPLDAAPDAVFAMLSDPAYRERVLESGGVVSHETTLEPRGAGFHLVMDQVQNTAGLPAIAQKIAGETTHVILTEEWDDAHSGTWHLDTPGKPVTTSGTVRIEARGAASVVVHDLELKVKVPVVGGKLEKLMAQNLTDGLDGEQHVAEAWLAEH
ncbi:DUF2505 domain-containing protein [Nocardioides acrostichi]|uniref:DUF2505 domain-containing protein n=1 Tax=Nocardioides acrostichi TaxID=2784339 RepID=A0A930UZ20_9ACTN|nr:DUF2505 domain-containing protein [Nocardioides acrostichi]MBF4162357.1 DUF2505 domain-containing protein [Nocardioides acrostichi]